MLPSAMHQVPRQKFETPGAGEFRKTARWTNSPVIREPDFVTIGLFSVGGHQQTKSTELIFPSFDGFSLALDFRLLGRSLRSATQLAQDKTFQYLVHTCESSDR